MLLGNLIKCSNKNYRKITVTGIAFDSRKVKKGDIFFAIQGSKTSGIKFINQALSKGASAIISNKKIKHKNYKTPLEEGIIFSILLSILMAILILLAKALKQDSIT